jgi:hypothetical protein
MMKIADTSFAALDILTAKAGWPPLSALCARAKAGVDITDGQRDILREEAIRLQGDLDGTSTEWLLLERLACAIEDDARPLRTYQSAVS